MNPCALRTVRWTPHSVAASERVRANTFHLSPKHTRKNVPVVRKTPNIMPMRIGLVYDLRKDYLAQGYPEDAVAEFDSDETIDALDRTIASIGYQTDRIGNVRALCSRLVAGDRWDLVFNIAEGLKGRSREAQAPCILELYDIPYTFSDPLVCAVTLDKAVTKRLLIAAGLRTPRFAVVAVPADVSNINLDYPLFAKPIAEGTGKGIDVDSRVDSPAELSHACGKLLKEYPDQAVLVEEFLPGREFTVGILGTGENARVIGTMEIVIPDGSLKAIYSYKTKELCDSLVKYYPAPRDGVRDAVEDLALESYRALECRDAGRADIRLNASGEPSFMEVNPLPGLHPTHSDLPMIATQEGMSYSQLIASIIQSARRRK
jgi:D-alanine-D-alanine ligase